MINENELQISNQSYTNKDFASVYPELVSLAQRLSARWDPSASNESDPGVVLLKLMAFYADKNDYNIDKNALEAYMPSVTQDRSMRALCEMNGYEMGYYNAATADVTFMYNGSVDDNGDELLQSGDSITLPAFSTVVTDEDGTVSYTLLEDAVLTARGLACVKPAMQGVAADLSVSDSTTLQLSSMDDDRRIYFPETMVAANGVFVTDADASGASWSKASNLNVVEPGRKVFKVGYDSDQGLPYVEFPSDVASIIGVGVKVKYIVTNGADGNVVAGFLSKVSAPTSVDTDINATAVSIDSDTMTVANKAATSDGADPEGIDEAYSGFKKTIGVFDTLITCRDYASAIYSLEDPLTGRSVVSNAQVGDRRTDANYSNPVVTYDEKGAYATYVPLISAAEGGYELITPFDLCLYPLKPISSSCTADSYAASFTPLFDLTDVESGLSEEKCAAHEYKSLSDGDLKYYSEMPVYAYKVYAALDAKISTVSKVGDYEQQSILANVRNALYEKFNAREVDFGYEIPYDSILSAIQGADSRIKSVSLAEPSLSVKAMLVDPTADPAGYREEPYLTPYYSGDVVVSNPYVTLAAKNVLAGRASLFDYDESFAYDFGQSVTTSAAITGAAGPTLAGLKTLTTLTTISAASVTVASGYTLRANEGIQLIAPSIVTEVTYPAYVNYRFLPETRTPATAIAANEEYKLTGGDVLKINYTDPDDNVITITYSATSVSTVTNGGVAQVKTGAVNIFRPSMEMKAWAAYSSDNPHSSIYPDPVTTSDGYYTLGTNEMIDKRKIVQQTFSDADLPCYWFRNTVDDALFASSDAVYAGEDVDHYEVILGDGEYFIYSNSALTDLVVLGSGTKLTYRASSIDEASWKITSDLLDVKDVADQGLSAFSALNWRHKNFSAYALEAMETQIITLAEGDSIRCSSSAWDFDLTNSWSSLSSAVASATTYTIDGSAETLPAITVSGLSWQARSRLHVACPSSTSAQEILSGQTFTFGTTSHSTIAVSKDTASGARTYISFNKPLASAGGVDMSLQVSYVDGKAPDYSLEALVFNKTAIALNGNSYLRDSDGFFRFDAMDFYASASPYGRAALSLPMIPVSGEIGLVAVYWDKPSDATTEYTLQSLDSASAGVAALRRYNLGSDSPYLSAAIPLLAGLNVFEIDGSAAVASLSLANTEGTHSDSPSDVISIGALRMSAGLNSAFNFAKLATASYTKDQYEEALLSAIRRRAESDGKDIFYYVGDPSSDREIEETDLSKAEALWDQNNVGNRQAIEEIDVAHSTIEIVRSSKA